MYNVIMAKITDSDIERILKVKNADLGLFVLVVAGVKLPKNAGEKFPLLGI